MIRYREEEERGGGEKCVGVRARAGALSSYILRRCTVPRTGRWAKYLIGNRDPEISISNYVPSPGSWFGVHFIRPMILSHSVVSASDVGLPQPCVDIRLRESAAMQEGETSNGGRRGCTQQSGRAYDRAVYTSQ